jgi:hypothetical protein
MFETTAELGPGDSLGIGLAAMLSGTKRLAVDIDDKIKDRHFPSKLTPQFSIGLIADEHFDHAVLIALAR